MSGDNLAIALFLWSLAALFFFEGRKEEGWRRWLLWGLFVATIAMGFGWQYLEPLWPQGYGFVKTIAVSPQSWFVLFMVALVALWLHQWRKEVVAAATQAARPPTGPGSPISTPELRRDLEAQILDMNNRLNNRIATILQKLDDPPGPPKPAINWQPWKHRSHYTLYEFAKILAKTDPAAQAMNTEGSAFARLLKEDIELLKLKYVPRYRVGEFNGKRYEVDIDYDTEISRPDAIAWANSKQFLVDHIS